MNNPKSYTTSDRRHRTKTNKPKKKPNKHTKWKTEKMSNTIEMSERCSFIIRLSRCIAIQEGHVTISNYCPLILFDRPVKCSLQYSHVNTVNMG